MAGFAIAETLGNLSLNQENNSFMESPDLYWKVTSHFRISFRCPENADGFKISQRLNVTGFEQTIPDTDIQGFLDECGKTPFFYFEGKPFEQDIQDCFDKIAAATPALDFSTNPKIRNEIIRECYIQSSLTRTVNTTKRISLLENRTAELVDSIKSEIAGTSERPVLAEKYDPLNGTDGGNDIDTCCNVELGNACGRSLDVGPELTTES